MVAIISHDAGGAEILSSWLKYNCVDYCLCICGPAVNVFKSKKIKGEILTLEQAISLADWILCGSSWMSDLEVRAIILSKKYNKKAVVFLDHWTNYLERFEFNGERHFPDEIWVGDTYAYELTKKMVQIKSKVILKENPYFIQIKDTYALINKEASSSNSILYVCESIKKHALMKFGDELYWGYNEDTAIDFFFFSLNANKTNVYEIVLRPHPADELNKYDWVVDKYQNYNIKIGGKVSLIEEIANSSIVIGCSSMAMVIALQLGKKVQCSIPPGRGICNLPFKEIEFIRNLDNLI
jgi:hypothetical protein